MKNRIITRNIFEDLRIFQNNKDTCFKYLKKNQLDSSESYIQILC